MALRADDLGSAAHTLSTRAAGLGIDDAVLGHANLHEVPWRTDFTREARRDVLVLSGGQPSRFNHHLESELRLRGANVESIDAEDVWFALDGELRVGDGARALPEAVISGTNMLRYHKLLGQFSDAGTHVVNGAKAVVVGRDKNVGARVAQRAGLPIPQSVVDITRMGDLLDAADQVRFPLVLKHPRSAMGLGVRLIEDERQLVDAAYELVGMTDNAPSRVGLLVQEKLDLANRDLRTHTTRDAVTDEMRFVGATDRVALNDDFRANGPAGNMIRPIHDLSGNDPALPQEAMELAKRAADVSGMDAAAIDIGQRADTGQFVVIEIDNYAHPLEANHPVPRGQQTFARMADYAVFGEHRT